MIIGGRIGEGESQIGLSTVLSYQIATNDYKELSELPSPRFYGHASIYRDSTVYVFGGQTSENGTQSNKVLALKDTDEDWKILGKKMPRRLSDFIVIPYN